VATGGGGSGGGTSMHQVYDPHTGQYRPTMNM